MAGGPRLLCIMGSGETAPTMRAVHEDLLGRVAQTPGPAVLLDTPYGFQENADELNARTTGYFAKNVGHDIEVVSWRERGDALSTDRALARVRSASYVFAGPGSPTYALRQWLGTGLDDALRTVLDRGGCVTFASAAALTLGVATVPVYEVYKAGLPVAWHEGLDVFSVTGLRAAVIPHFDNAEGGTHDTRFCYLGERRLRILESALPPDTFVFGVDEHTAAVIDLDRRSVGVVGRGGVTLRVDGRSHVLRGDVVTIDDVREVVDGLRASPVPPASGTTVTTDGTAPVEETSPGRSEPVAAPPKVDPLTRLARDLDARQREAVAARDVDGAVAATLELEQALQDWSADTLTGEQVDRARALLRGMVIRLGDLAARGARDPAELVAPFVEATLAARDHVRAQRQFALADDLRDRLGAAGIEVRDTPDGVEWELTIDDVVG